MPNRDDWIEGCLVLTQDQWHVVLSALDRFADGRTVPVKARARKMARDAFKQILQYVLTEREVRYGD